MFKLFSWIFIQRGPPANRPDAFNFLIQRKISYFQPAQKFILCVDWGDLCRTAWKKLCKVCVDSTKLYHLFVLMLRRTRLFVFVLVILFNLCMRRVYVRQAGICCCCMVWGLSSTCSAASRMEYSLPKIEVGSGFSKPSEGLFRVIF